MLLAARRARSWMVAAVLALAVMALAAARANAAIAVTFNAAPPEILVPQGSPMPVSVDVTSQFDVASVVARVNTLSANLAPATLPTWTGTMDLTSLPYGNFVVTVTATDVFGATASASRMFAHDEPPRVTVTSPLPNSVARPTVHVTATCTDDDPGGACRLFGATSAGGGLSGANNLIDADLDLSSADGEAITLWVSARDWANQPVGPRIPLLVEDSPDLIDVASLGVRMLDVDETRFLYVGADGVVRVRARANANQTVLGPVADTRPATPPYGRLTSTGAIYVSIPATIPSCGRPQESFEWRGAGAPVSLGIQCENLQDGPWTIVGDWGWRMQGDGQVVRRNFATGVEAVVTFPADVGGPLFTLNRYLLARNGDLVKAIAATNEIRFVRDHGGVQTEIGRGTVGSQNNPVYDGTAIAYLHPDNPNDRVAMIRDGQPPLVLGDPLIPQYPGQTYQVGGGRVAFTRVSATSGARQIWRRNLDGSLQNLTPFAADTIVDVVAASGDLTVITGGVTRYLATDGLAPPAHVGSELGRARFLSDALYVVIGRSVLRCGPGGGVPSDDGLDAAVALDASVDAFHDADIPDTDAGIDAGTAKPGDGGCSAGGGAGGGAGWLLGFLVAMRFMARTSARRRQRRP
jgi:hypothetical protein